MIKILQKNIKDFIHGIIENILIWTKWLMKDSIIFHNWPLSMLIHSKQSLKISG